MMTSFNDFRRGYDDRYDVPEWQLRQGRLFDPRGQSYERLRRFNGDGMRDPSWMRDVSYRRVDAELAPMVKVIEVFAQSPHSWEDATRRAVAEATQTIRGIRSISIEDMYAVVDEDHVVSFRINAKISFALDDNRWRR
ncbi:MAG: dodecin domain-containing protein [Labilithrix sp.]|nr:dodecin domain-containing protein [Labilithrix sp.]MBX3219369.1 dodecin domain-containing protein [Labilithrix sp.]